MFVHEFRVFLVGAAAGNVAPCCFNDDQFSMLQMFHFDLTILWTVSRISMAFTDDKKSSRKVLIRSRRHDQNSSLDVR